MQETADHYFVWWHGSEEHEAWKRARDESNGAGAGVPKKAAVVVAMQGDFGEDLEADPAAQPIMQFTGSWGHSERFHGTSSSEVTNSFCYRFTKAAEGTPGSPQKDGLCWAGDSKEGAQQEGEVSHAVAAICHWQRIRLSLCSGSDGPLATQWDLLRPLLLWRRNRRGKGVGTLLYKTSLVQYALR